MLIQCNGLFPRPDKNGEEQIGGVIEQGGVKYWARANVAQGTLSLSLSVMRDEGGFTNAGTVVGKNHGSGIFSFAINDGELMLAVRRVAKEGGKLPVGTLFLGSLVAAQSATQADLAAMLEDGEDNLAAPVAPLPPVARKRAPRVKA